MRWRLTLAGDNDADVCHCQGILRLDGWRSAEGDEDTLRGSRAVVDVGAASVRCGLDDLAALNETLLALIQNPDKHNIFLYLLRKCRCDCVQKDREER